jgi:flavorubredoxin
MTTACFTAVPGIDVIASTVDIPSLGSLTVNAFVLHGSEPLLVDTGTVAGNAEFIPALRSVIDPQALRWIWLTHTDFDHIGALAGLLDENPRIRVITSLLGVGIMGLSSTPLPIDRVHLVNPGQTVHAGDRRLTAVRPPVFDNPITTGFFDDLSGAFFSSDCFGALLPSIPDNAADLDLTTLQSGQIRWATIDSSWVPNVDRVTYAANLREVGAARPSLICSSHLPPARGGCSTCSSTPSPERLTRLASSHPTRTPSTPSSALRRLLRPDPVGGPGAEPLSSSWFLGRRSGPLGP